MFRWLKRSRRAKTSAGTVARKRAESLKRSPLWPRKFADGAAVVYLGAGYALRITFDHAAPQGCALSGGDFIVNLPDSAPAEAPHAAELEALLWFKRRAREILRERMEHWSARLDLRYRRLIVNHTISRWGSCTRDNDIRLNWRVVMAAPEIIDYLVVHELCHVREKNHSPKFWALVAAALPDHKERRLALRSMR